MDKLREQIEQIIGPQTEGAGSPAQPKPADPDKEPFAYNVAPDNVGLPLEHPRYAKRSCNWCYGRGYVIQMIPNRHYQTCNCVHRGYTRTRLRFERETLALVKTGAPLTAARQALLAVYGFAQK